MRLSLNRRCIKYNARLYQGQRQYNISKLQLAFCNIKAVIDVRYIGQMLLGALNRFRISSHKYQLHFNESYKIDVNYTCKIKFAKNENKTNKFSLLKLTG